jgi:cytochrome c oxidase cbb3-type subunit 4
MIEGVTYQQAVAFAHSWGAVYFLLMFIVACAYAFWPSNKKKFQEAANLPLHDDDLPP